MHTLIFTYDYKHVCSFFHVWNSTFPAWRELFFLGFACTMQKVEQSFSSHLFPLFISSKDTHIYSPNLCELFRPENIDDCQKASVTNVTLRRSQKTFLKVSILNPAVKFTEWQSRFLAFLWRFGSSRSEIWANIIS